MVGYRFALVFVNNFYKIQSNSKSILNVVAYNRAILWSLESMIYDLWFILWSLISMWHRGVVVITTAQLHSTKPELRFCAGSNPARGVSEIYDGEDLWQWSRLKIRPNVFRCSTLPQKQFIIIIIIIIII